MQNVRRGLARPARYRASHKPPHRGARGAPVHVRRQGLSCSFLAKCKLLAVRVDINDADGQICHARKHDVVQAALRDLHAGVQEVVWRQNALKLRPSTFFRAPCWRITASRNRVWHGFKRDHLSHFDATLRLP